jgi:GT2 family glycosyltransferase
MSPAISAYVPCCNHAATIGRVVEALRAQTVQPAEILVIDDGSDDAPGDALRGLDVRLIRHDRSLGRGAARARAMREARHELVLCCDATNTLDPAFIERALPWLRDPSVAAVYGRMRQPPPRNLAERWRGRHLFKIQVVDRVRRGAMLSTWGSLVRATAVRAVGGFNSDFRHTEDRDLGGRLLAVGYDVIYDPALEVMSIGENTMAQVLERYWRWYAGPDESVTWRAYWKNVGYSIKSMALDDLRAGDLLSVPVSLLTPHYQFWQSWRRRRRADDSR